MTDYKLPSSGLSFSQPSQQQQSFPTMNSGGSFQTPLLFSLKLANSGPTSSSISVSSLPPLPGTSISNPTFSSHHSNPFSPPSSATPRQHIPLQTLSPVSTPKVVPFMSDSKSHFPLKQSDFDCNVCFSLLCEPVTIPCGHTFCRSCLVSCLERTKKKCPACRAPCHIQAETQAASTLLVTIIEKLYPEEYKRRLQELAAEKADWARKIPLFLCGSPMFPYQPLSLHLFEPRYRLMVQRVLQSNKRFGVIASDKLKAGDVGTIFEITECQFLPDGRALCESVGRTRFMLKEFWVEDGTQGLHYGVIEDLDDERNDGEKASTPSFMAPPTLRSRAPASDDSMPRLQSMDEDEDPETLELALEMSKHDVDSVLDSSRKASKEPSAEFMQRAVYLSRLVRDTMREFMHVMPHLKTQLDKHYGPMPGGVEGSTPPTAPNFLAECAKLSFWVASILPMPAHMKLQMLGSKSLLSRLELSVQMLRSLLDDIKKRASDPQANPMAAPAGAMGGMSMPASAPAGPAPQQSAFSNYNVNYPPRPHTQPNQPEPYQAITSMQPSATGSAFM